jgi:tRNA (guanine37-N1)-methyltransferase
MRKKEMKIDIITLFPEMLEGPLGHSIVKRALDKGLAEIRFFQLRNWSNDKHNRVDDYPFGGGAGMVMKAEPLAACIDELCETTTYDEIIFLTPDGQTLNQNTANELSLKGNLLMICGHYKGIDQRIRDLYVTREISIGDYVLSGGELAAAVLADTIIRVIPGVLGDETSALSDSFQDGLLDAPCYTRPADFRGLTVPEILLSGHDAKISAWRHEQSVQKTKERRPDLLH